jgi:hypothetical protein
MSFAGCDFKEQFRAHTLALDWRQRSAISSAEPLTSLDQFLRASRSSGDCLS